MKTRDKGNPKPSIYLISVSGGNIVTVTPIRGKQVSRNLISLRVIENLRFLQGIFVPVSYTGVISVRKDEGDIPQACVGPRDSLEDLLEDVCSWGRKYLLGG
jgi:hypothetical protein